VERIYVMGMNDISSLQWGLTGCGDIAKKRVAPSLRDSRFSELVAVNRAQPELAESFAKEFGARRWYSDWRELLQDSEINAVYVATPVNLHCPQTIAAAEAGKHVLCEKPMALNAEECERMISACRANNVKLGIAYYRHFYPAIRRIKEVIMSGEIGTPVVVQMNSFEWFNAKHDEPRSWLLQKDVAGGGPMFDFGCHRIEVLANLLGPIKDVQAVTARVLFEREVEDTAIAVFRFSSGMCGSLAVTHAAQEPQDTLDLFGSDGSIHMKGLTEGTVRIVCRDGERTELHPAAANIHQPLIDDFIDAVLNDRAPRVGGEIGKMVAEIEERIYSQSNGSHSLL
jgi:predicted dehydrogenase